ncbi:MAG TPA: TonB family protein, partial [Longimicrobiales bacterium]|nr:TonB family protein [Longimicrobiales bacterium]
MIEDLNLDPIPGLPDDLAELDEELRGIRMAERPSFGPELEAELERVWREDPRPVSSSGATRRALAASVGAVLFAGMLVPPARAAIAELSRQSLRLLGVAHEEVSATVPPPAATPGLLRPQFALVSPPGSSETDPPALPRARTTSDDPEGAEPPAEDGPVEEPSPEFPPYEDVEVAPPRLVDQRADEEAIRRYYPPALEEEGIGGTVVVRGWVDSTGVLRNVSVAVSSGYPAMDRAAERAARELRYHPAKFGDRAVGTPVEIPMAFVPLPAVPSRPVVMPVERPALPEGLDTDFAALWPDQAVVPAPYQVEAQKLLRAAMGRPADLEARFGSVEHLLTGEPPSDAFPTRWRSAATTALEEARLRDPDNPAPYIALGRIHKRMGLRADALALFEKGIERASRGRRGASPRLVAELNYERGMLLKDGWLGVRDLGRISPEEVAGIRCAAGGGGTLVDRLIGLNYLCYDEVASLLEEGFEPVRPADSPRERMLEAFRAAVAVYPAHVGANVELLLDRADEGRWFDMLNEARAFAWASRGDPHALLLSGLALQRLGRPDEAMDDFALALRSLPDDEVRLIQDIGPLLSEEERRGLAQLSAEELEARTEAFWSGLDPLRLTEVNERRVEHLARATYALLRLGGTDTDAGDVWIRYGPPVAVHTLGEGTPLRTEFWSFERGPALTF